MSDESATALESAAEAFRANRITTDPFPVSERHYHLLLEVAFMSGAQWYQGNQINQMEQRLAELHAELKGVTANA